MASEPLPFSLIPLWVQSLQGIAAGLTLAREKNSLLAWDRGNWLYLLNASGHIQAQVRFAGDIAQACIADDGSTILAAGKNGLVRLLGPDLSLRWEKHLDHPLLAAALEPFGLFAVVSDVKSNVLFLSAAGEMLGHFASPRPLHHLSFTASQANLAGSADFGLVGTFDRSGNWSWKDAPVVKTGGMAAGDDGAPLLLACYSEGIHRYGARGERLARLATPGPCSLVAQSFTGERIAAAGLAAELFTFAGDGKLEAQAKLEQPLTDVAISPLGDVVYGCVTGGGVMKWKVKAK